MLWMCKPTDELRDLRNASPLFDYTPLVFYFVCNEGQL